MMYAVHRIGAQALAGVFSLWMLLCPVVGQAASAEPTPTKTGQTPQAGPAGQTLPPSSPSLSSLPSFVDPAREAALRAQLAELEATRDALRTMLTADPCTIPSEVGGLVLELPQTQGHTSAPSVPAVGSGGSVASTSSSAPAVAPAAISSASSQTPPALVDTAAFTASADAIDAATPLILTGNSMGTGFFVAPGIVVTNRHVVEESPGLILLLNKAMGKLMRGKLLAIGRGDRDYALIKLEADGALPEPLPLCGGVRKTDRIASWGYPGAVSANDPKLQALMKGDLTAIPECVYSDGVVNVVYETAPSMVLHTAPISQGNSGGPLVNDQGCVVGINTMIHLDDESYRQTSIALVISDLVAFLQEQGISPRYKPTR